MEKALSMKFPLTADSFKASKRAALHYRVNRWGWGIESGIQMRADVRTSSGRQSHFFPPSFSEKSTHSILNAPWHLGVFVLRGYNALSLLRSVPSCWALVLSQSWFGIQGPLAFTKGQFYLCGYRRPKHSQK